MAKTIRVMDEIAFQSNILALNAAVEGAHADAASVEVEQVADEVGGLEQPSAAAETPVEEAECPTGHGRYTAEKLNAQSADLRNIAVRLAELAGGLAAKNKAAGSTQQSEVSPVRMPAKGASGF